mmetsp:Transcript_12390/g.18581  ORF Transcript_12390/g.18581 Transcript_12390/m.18581 type:complete len:217 (+) Transcript_12390:93-743(+)
MVIFLSLVLPLFLVLAHRIYLTLPLRKRKHGINSLKKGAAKVERKIPTMVVLGSGGHTSEMMKMIQNIDLEIYSPLLYIIAESDLTSFDRIPKSHVPYIKITKIPRSREVGQKWISTFFTTVYATIISCRVIISFRPELLLVNGPGTCLPLCFWVYMLKIVGWKKKSKIIFVESFCRVETLSFTGKLIYPFADRFLVQWPELVEKYPKSEYIGQLI